MKFWNYIWDWIRQTTPEEDEEALRAEEVLLEARLARIQEELTEANNRKAYLVAERLVKELRAKRGTELTQLERNFLKSFTSREECKHLKGGPMRQVGKTSLPWWDKYAGPFRSAHKDYSVRDHTFPDGSRVIRCTICSEKWTKDSPDWKQALEMSRNSTNTPSSSEISRTVIEGDLDPKGKETWY